MSDKNFMAYGDAEPIFTEYATAIKGRLIQLKTTPVASPALVGKTIQYTGEDDNVNNFLHNYFYELRFTEIENPSGDPYAQGWWKETTSGYEPCDDTETSVDPEVTYGTVEWVNITVQPADSIQVVTLPTPSASEYEAGNIYQYIGPNGVYQRGAMYECVPIEDTDPVEYEWKIIDFSSQSVYNQSIEFGYRSNSENEMFQTIMNSAGFFANSMLGEVDGAKYLIGPTKTTQKWVQDSLTFDPSNGDIYWGGVSPLNYGTSSWSKYRYCLNKLVPTTGEITNLDLELYTTNASGKPNGYIWEDGGTTAVKEIAFYDNYIYVVARSSGDPRTRPATPEDKYGAFIIVNKSTMTIESTQFINGKCTGITIHEHGTGANKVVYIVLNARQELVKFGIIDNNDPTSVTWKQTEYFDQYPVAALPAGATKNMLVNEHQKGGIFHETEDGKVLYIVAGFGDGVYVWDVTDTAGSNVTLAGRFRFTKAFADKYHTFSCVVEYPYVYATLAPNSDVFAADFDVNRGYCTGSTRREGILTLDISNLDNITYSVQNIPVDDMSICDYPFDTLPTIVRKSEDKLFLNNGDRGVAIYDISTPDRPIYLGTKIMTEVNSIGGLAILGDYLIVGDSPKCVLGAKDISYITPKYIKGYEIYKGYKNMLAGGNTPDAYGALISVDVMHDLSQYDSATSVNVKDLGATGDGTTPDNAAFTQALASGKANILIPHGTYNLNSVSMTIPAGVNLIGENAHNTVLLNNNWNAPYGMTAKYLTFEGGTRRAIPNMSNDWQPTAIIDASPSADTAAHNYESCIFKAKDGEITHHASIAYQEKSGMNYNGTTYHKIASDVFNNCIFENLMYGGIHHGLTIDDVRVTNCTFRNFGTIDDVPFKVYVATERTSMPDVTKSVGKIYKYTGETSGDLVQGTIYIGRKNSSTDTYYWGTDINPKVDTDWAEIVSGVYKKSTDTTFDLTKYDNGAYYEPIGRSIIPFLVGDPSNNTTNKALRCVVDGCSFSDLISNSFYYAPAHSDEANFIKMLGEFVVITNNKFKNLTGYGNDREGVYTKARNCEIAYNYLENAGMGEGYICCKNYSISQSDRVVYIHDNTIIGTGGRGIRTYYGSTIENNTIFIENAKSGIWAGGNDDTKHGTIIRNNYVAVSFDNYYLTDDQSVTNYGANVEPTNYHERTCAVESIKDSFCEITGNDVVAWLLRSTAGWAYAYAGIRTQVTYEHLKICGNRVLTNGDGTVRIYGIQHIQAKAYPAVKGLLVDVNDNNVRDTYMPIEIYLYGYTQSKSTVNVKNNTIWAAPSVNVGRANKKCGVTVFDRIISSSYVYTADKATILNFETTQKTMEFADAYVCTDCTDVVTDDINKIMHINSPTQS